jgi:hypothetical protein
LKTAGQQTVTVTDTANSTVTGNASISVVAGPVAQLGVQLASGHAAVKDRGLQSAARAKPASGTLPLVTEGSSFSVSVTALDAYGNTNSTYAGTVHFTSTDTNATLPADYPYTSSDLGTHTFSVTLNTLGAQTVTVTDTVTPSITGGLPVQVVPPSLTVTVNLNAGWHLIGGDLTILPDSTSTLSWNAASGHWVVPTGSEPMGTGAWELLSSSGAHTIYVLDCGGGTPVTVVPYRWNMIGNGCTKSTNLPAGWQGLDWNGTRYVPATSIAPGLALWVKPGGNALTLGNGT